MPFGAFNVIQAIQSQWDIWWWHTLLNLFVTLCQSSINLPSYNYCRHLQPSITRKLKDSTKIVYQSLYYTPIPPFFSFQSSHPYPFITSTPFFTSHPLLLSHSHPCLYLTSLPLPPWIPAYIFIPSLHLFPFHHYICFPPMIPICAFISLSYLFLSTSHPFLYLCPILAYIFILSLLSSPFHPCIYLLLIPCIYPFSYLLKSHSSLPLLIYLTSLPLPFFSTPPLPPPCLPFIPCHLCHYLPPISDLISFPFLLFYQSHLPFLYFTPIYAQTLCISLPSLPLSPTQQNSKHLSMCTQVKFFKAFETSRSTIMKLIFLNNPQNKINQFGHWNKEPVNKNENYFTSKCMIHFQSIIQPTITTNPEAYLNHRWWPFMAPSCKECLSNWD